MDIIAVGVLALACIALAIFHGHLSDRVHALEEEIDAAHDRLDALEAQPVVTTTGAGFEVHKVK